jgi:ribonuclease P protein component
VPARKVGRIQTRTTFGQLQRSRAKANCGPVRASFVPAAEAEDGVFPQVGYAIARQCGNAVTRNTLRRRMRASAELVAGNLPKGAYLLRVDPRWVSSNPETFSASVQEALQRAGGAGRSMP